jgi:Mg2+/citrate symporter
MKKKKKKKHQKNPAQNFNKKKNKKKKKKKKKKPLFFVNIFRDLEDQIILFIASSQSQRSFMILCQIAEDQNYMNSKVKMWVFVLLEASLSFAQIKVSAI